MQHSSTPRSQPNEMTIPVLLADVGVAHDSPKVVRSTAVLDPAARATWIPRSLLDSVVQGKDFSYTYKRVRGVVGDEHHVMSVYVQIGVVDSQGNTEWALLPVIVTDSEGPVGLGQDAMRQLGLKFTLDWARGDIKVDSYNWQSFESEVASLYRILGAHVTQNVALAGFQIDMVVVEQTGSGQNLRLAVECKYYREKIGNRIVNDFVRIVQTLKSAGLVDKGVLVSESGFTTDARLVAGSAAIELLEIADLRSLVQSRGLALPEATPAKQAPTERPAAKSPPDRKTQNPPRVFVIMPFLSELDDVYHLGIREVVARLGAVCERADEILYVGGVMEKIRASIEGANVVVAELTTPNVNVYYELGFAHALDVPSILLTRDTDQIPFDVKGYNHVRYASIVQLRSRLEELLKKLLSSSD